MKRIVFAAIIAVAFYIVGLDLDYPHKSYAQSKLPEYELYWEGLKINDILKDREYLEKIRPEINKFAGELGGFAGLIANLFKCASEYTLVNDEPTFVRLHGDIVGYHLSHENMAGFLAVDTDSYATTPDKRICFLQHEWYIFVNNDTFKVVPKVADITDPFPNTVELPEAILTEIETPGTKLNLMTHKLFAKGEGIEVLLVYENGLPLPPEHFLYETDENSCIDIFFDDFPPESDLPVKPSYCLGRCATPRILGTM
jgi:hypothetical protein